MKFLFLILSTFIFSPVVHAGYDIENVRFSQEALDDNELKWKLIHHAKVDLRFSHTSSPPSWASDDSSPIDGNSPLRYGSSQQDSSSTSAFHLSQAQWISIIKQDEQSWTGMIHLYTSDYQDQREVTLIDAWLEKKWSKKNRQWSVLAGRIWPDITLTQRDLFQSQDSFISYNTIDSWFSEAFRPTGLHFSYQHDFEDMRLKTSLSTLSETDTFGTEIALRGWASHDYMLSSQQNIKLHQNNWLTNSSTHQEFDGRLSYLAYFYADWNETYTLSGASYLGNNSIRKTDLQATESTWDTNFNIINFKWSPNYYLSFSSSYLFGDTQSFFSNHIFSFDFDSYNFEAAYRYKQNTFAFRYEAFSSDFKTDPQLDQKASLIGLAFARSIHKSVVLKMEYLYFDNDRDSLNTNIPREQDYRLAQLSLAAFF